MNVLRAGVAVSLLLLGISANAQHLYGDCRAATQDQLQQCLESAISAEGKQSCLETQAVTAQT